ncbi:MAG: phenylalanine--tRNA ligase subunit alpha [Patescibacteria group bacterium]
MYQQIFNTANPQTVNETLKLRDDLLRSGQIIELTQQLKEAAPEHKAELGKRLQELKNNLQETTDSWIRVLQAKAEANEKIEPFDPTLESSHLKRAPKRLHPITQVIQELVEIYKGMGFDVAEGPLVETQWYNFTALNIPDYHPARGMQDTFFLQNTDESGEKLVLRTQTSDVQIRYMEQNKPPLRIVVPGIVFRNEDIDATHDMQFHQMEGLVVDKNISIANLKFYLEETFRKFFNDDNIEIRLRPSYFPFVAPGYEVDVRCPFCKGQGCRVCKQTTWIECVGAGLVHPDVLRSCGIDPNEYQGLAFGFGVDRLAQMKLEISGLSQFYNSNLSFLES